MVSLALLLESQEGLTWPSLFAAAGAADDLGFDGLYLSDHFGSVEITSEREVMPAWTAVAVLAARMHSLRLGPLVSPMTFRHPVDLCKQAIALDLLTGGRIDVGIGAGWHRDEHTRFGLPFPEPGVRVRMLAEGLEVFTRLWTESDVSWSGEFYSLDSATVMPRPLTHRPPIILGGDGPRMLGLAAEFAQEWNCLYKNLGEFSVLMDSVDEACVRTGRDPKRLARSVMTPLLIARTEAEAEKRIAAHRHVFGGLPASLAEWRAAGFIGGIVPEVQEQLAAWGEIGLSRVIFEHNEIDDRESLELLAEIFLESAES